MDRIPVLDVKLRKVTCFKPGGNDFSTNQARRPAWPEIPGENTELSRITCSRALFKKLKKPRKMKGLCSTFTSAYQ